MSVTDRGRFAKHAAPEAIQSQLDQAYAAQLTAARDIKWLTELLLARMAQVRAGEWPAGDPDTPGGTT